MSQIIHEFIDKRWSPRAFSNREIEVEKINALFEAASCAASCFNEQPWRFIYASKEYAERYDQLLSCLVEFNKLWARNAPVIMMALTSKKFAQNQKINHYARHDLGLAIGNMTIQATSMNLYLHQMAGFDSDKAREVFDIPDDFDIVSMIALGYLGDPKQLPENIREMESKERSRRSTDKIIFDGNWEQLK
ncbi:nitroreductase family protein [Labilibaculum sp.]|uniref:nitroreductase family protein n=1 Tax=Labilibaculum sp. TaxID=2060723 RepID=UPI003561E260